MSAFQRNVDHIYSKEGWNPLLSDDTKLSLNVFKIPVIPRPSQFGHSSRGHDRDFFVS